MPVGYTNRTFDPGNFGIGSLAQMAMGAFARGRGASPQAEPSMKGVYGFDPAATAAAPARDYLGGNVQGAQALLKALVPQPPPPERGPVPQLAGGPPVPMSKPPLGPAMAGYQGGGPVVGNGDGRSDSVPALVDGQGIAQLSTDEYVVPADVVSALGRGSSAAGAKKLDAAVQQMRSGYATKLKGMPKPKAGGGKKFLGGLFETKQESDIQLPDYLRDVAGSIPGRIKSYEKARPSAVSEVARFTPDQQAFFERSRQAAGDVTGAQSAYQRGQDLLGGIYQGGDPWSDQLIEQSMGEYDRGTAIDAAGRRRAAAGRGAFGEGTQLAEVEAGAAAARGRGLLGSQLREQGLTRRTQAAEQIGELAGRERQANIGDLGLLGGIGEIQYGRAQEVAKAPWEKVARVNSLLQNAPTSTTATTQESPLKMMIGLGAVGGGFFKSGGRVRAGGRASHRKRAQKEQLYADGGKVRIPRSKPERWSPSPPQLPEGLDTPKRVRASQQDLLDQQMPEPFIPDTGDENEIFEGYEPLEPQVGSRGTPLRGRRRDQLKLADGGQVGPGAFQRIEPPPYERVPDWRTVTGGGNSFTSDVVDWIKSRTPFAEDSPFYRPELLPPPPERTTPKTPAQRAAELLGVGAPAAATPASATPAPTAPIPVSKPARVPDDTVVAKSPRRSITTTTPTAAAPAPVPAAGIGALPERLRSPEDPITAAPPSGIKVAEAPPPPPPANAPPEAKQNWFDRWSSNPLTQFGLAMMASSPGESVGSAIGRSGLAAISGAAAGRKEQREEQRLALADQRAQAKEDRDEKADVRAMMKLGLDERQATEVAANNREQRRQADERIKLQEQQGQQRIALEQARINEQAGFHQARLGQHSAALAIRREAARKVAGGKASDPDKVLREKLQTKLADAIDLGDPEKALELRKAIAALSPAVAGGGDYETTLPEGYDLEEEE